MSARSCQLCGKPLSRWASSDGDFCSREHRNQFRLRQGMGRLQEANKVANVMRRREQLRPLQNANLANPSARTPRGFQDVKFAPGAKLVLAPAKIAAQRPPARIVSTSNRFLPPTLLCGAGSTAPAAAMSVPFGTRRSPLAPRQQDRKLSTQMQQAQTVEGSLAAQPPKTRRRDFDVRLSIRKRILRDRRMPGNPAAELLRVGRTEVIKTSPVSGNVMRVSFSCRLRPRPGVRRFSPIDPHIEPKLRWREERGTLQAVSSLVLQARSANAIAIPPAALMIPSGPDAVSRENHMSRGPLRMRTRPMPGKSLEARTEDGLFVAQTDFLAFPESALPKFRKPGLPELQFKRTRSWAAIGSGDHRYSVAPFVPQDVPCGITLNVNQGGGKDQKK